MPRKILKTPEEVIKVLKAGKNLADKDGIRYRMLDGFLIGTDRDGDETVNARIDMLFGLYIEEPEPIKIEEGKLYKTRAGEKAVCVYVDKTKICRMVIMGNCCLDYYWVKQTGECHENINPQYDIVAEQEM